ncbi:hypothetical protein JOC55_000567 [Paenibacillus sacheonensis]|nr:hypothetical protein [Paenibacillus sacheonensis]
MIVKKIAIALLLNLRPEEQPRRFAGNDHAAAIVRINVAA